MSPNDYNNSRRQGGRRHQGHSTSYGNDHWTSTPQGHISYRNPNFNTANDGTLNNSLLSLLDTQCQVQNDTTQALSKIIQLQYTRANDMYVNDLPTFSGEPQAFLDWILKVEKVSQLTGHPSRELATAKSKGAVFKCINNLAPTTSWDDCKLAL